jgi:hypothetical protein
MKKLAIIFLLLSVNYSSASDFVINPEPINVNSPLDQLGINMIPPLIDNPPNWIRQKLHGSYLGDYYRSPGPIPESVIKEEEKVSAWNFLKEDINALNYDSAIFSNISAYEYKLFNEELPRRDIFLRFSKADTVYVISGWVGKFISFYRSIPKYYKYDLNELNENISELSKMDIKIPPEIYEQCSKNNPYFIEYVDHAEMLRVRCYHIYEERMNIDTLFAYGPYTLIEITRFLDKEMVP